MRPPGMHAASADDEGVRRWLVIEIGAEPAWADWLGAAPAGAAMAPAATVAATVARMNLGRMRNLRLTDAVGSQDAGRRAVFRAPSVRCSGVRHRTPGPQPGEPGRGLVDDLVALAEGEPDERPPDRAVVVEDDGGHRHDAGALGQRPGEGEAVLLPQRADVSVDEVGAGGPVDLQARGLEARAEPVAPWAPARGGPPGVCAAA